MNFESADPAQAQPTRWALSSEIAELVRPWRRLLMVVGALVVAAALAELVPPFVIRQVVNDNLVPRRTEGLPVAALVYLAAVAAYSAFAFGYGSLAGLVAQRALAELRVRLFAHVARLPTQFFDVTPLGDVISRVTADVDTVDEVFTGGVVILVGQLVVLIGVTGAMLALSVKLTLIAALVAIPLVAITRYLQVRVRDAQRSARLVVGRLNAQLAEDVSAAVTIRAFDRGARFVERFRDALGASLIAANRSAYFNALFPPLTSLLAAIVTATLIWAGAGGWLPGAGVGFGTLTAFILLFQLFFAPIIAIGDEWQAVQAAIAGAERVFQLLRLPIEAAPTPAVQPAEGASGVSVHDVTFGYRRDLDVLRDVSLAVAPGEQVAVVGRTGAGKTSLLGLLGGLYSPRAGTITVAGRDPRALSDAERSSVIGVVPQTVQLFHGTLRQNLALFDTAISQAACESAARVTGLDAVIATFPDGYETLLAADHGGAGMTLSAGQRQLVALTRALVTEPSVLLLDEATAAIDGASDASFRAALRAAASSRGQAVLSVAHRLSTARDADRVVVFERGQVVEEGTPAALAAAGGRFSAMLELEAAGWDWRQGPETAV